jgi:hypothetical protein
MPDNNEYFSIPPRKEWTCWFYIPLGPVDPGWLGYIKIKTNDYIENKNELCIFPTDINWLNLQDLDMGLLIMRKEEKLEK